MIKRSLFRLSRSRVFAAFVSLLERIDRRRPNLLRVLTYHRVDEPASRPDLDPGMISAKPDDFARQMEFLASRYDVVGLDQVRRAALGDGPLPARSVLVTFDDAYQDFAEHAWPVLRRLGLPAVLFVPTAFPDNPGLAFWWDRLYAALCRGGVGREALEDMGIETPADVDDYARFRAVVRHMKRLDNGAARELINRVCRRGAIAAPHAVLGWEALRRLASAGLALGAHTRTHPLMNRVSVEQAVEEAAGSQADLRSRIGDVPSAFAYPAGAFSDAVVAGLRGRFDLAFTTCRGINDLGCCDPLRLRRINIGRHTPAPLVRAQLLAPARHLNVCWPIESAV